MRIFISIKKFFLRGICNLKLNTVIVDVAENQRFQNVVVELRGKVEAYNGGAESIFQIECRYAVEKSSRTVAVLAENCGKRIAKRSRLVTAVGSCTDSLSCRSLSLELYGGGEKAFAEEESSSLGHRKEIVAESVREFVDLVDISAVGERKRYTLTEKSIVVFVEKLNELFQRVFLFIVNECLDGEKRINGVDKPGKIDYTPTVSCTSCVEFRLICDTVIDKQRTHRKRIVLCTKLT